MHSNVNPFPSRESSGNSTITIDNGRLFTFTTDELSRIRIPEEIEEINSDSDE